MKKILCFIITASLIFSSSSVAFAKHNTDKGNKNNKKHTTEQENKKTRVKEKKKNFKLSDSPVIKYGKYKMPIRPITQGMGAAVNYNKETSVLTVTKGSTTIVINFKEKTVTVNGVADTNSGIFSNKNSKKSIVLIKYIANKLGVRVNVKGDTVTTEIPGLDLPTAVTVTPAGTVVVANTINSTTLTLAATATVKAGQATGGKAELYVGSKLVATDASILATDTTVTFTIGDETPTNAELQSIIPEGGVVSVKLYNAEQKSVVSAVANPTLTVDYVIPTLASVTNAVYTASGSAITLVVTGASAVNDKVDVTKISLHDSVLGTSYQLTDAAVTGSTAVVNSDKQITILLGTTDKLAVEKFSGTSVTLQIAAGSLLSDKAGNTTSITAQSVPVIIVK